jgi:hypothetical protein
MLSLIGLIRGLTTIRRHPVSWVLPLWIPAVALGPQAFSLALVFVRLLQDSLDALAERPDLPKDLGPRPQPRNIFLLPTWAAPHSSPGVIDQTSPGWSAERQTWKYTNPEGGGDVAMDAISWIDLLMPFIL